MAGDQQKNHSQLLAELEQARERVVRLKSRMLGDRGKEGGKTASMGELTPGDHVCCIYRSDDELRAVLLPFLHKGLELGHKSLVISDTATREAVSLALKHHGAPVDEARASGRLAFASTEETYLREGRFDPEAMIELLRQETEKALREGHAALRVVGDMSWAARGVPGSERLMEYEAELNRFLPGSGVVGLCLYDMRRFGPEVILDVLETHPIAVVGDRSYQNIYYLSPGEFLGQNRAEAELSRRLEQLERQRLDEEALRESEESYRELFERAPVGIFQSDSRGGLHRVNTEMARILGAIAPEEVMTRCRDLGRDFYIHPERREKFLRLLREQGEVEHFEFLARRLDGESANLSMNARISRWLPDGSFLIDGFLSDITERKRFETAQRESEDNFRNIFNNSGDAIFIHEINGRFLEVNDVACERLGYTRQELLAMSPVDIDAPDASQLAKDRMRSLERHGHLCFEGAHVCRDGTRIPVEISSRLIQYRGQKCILSTARDIGARKEAEAKRDEYQRILTSALHAMDSLFMVIDRDYRILLCNWRDHEWVPEEERERRPYCYQVLKSYEAPCEHCPPARTFSDGQVRHYEDQNPIDGSHKEIDVLPILDSQGQVEYVLENVRDVTQRKRSEEKIRHLNQVLAAIRNVNQLITAEKDRHRLLQGACDRLVETRGYNSAWIAFFDEAGRVPLCAEANVGDGFAELAEYLRTGQYPGCVEAALERRDLVEVGESGVPCSDCPLYGTYPGSSGIVTCLSHQGTVYGVLAVSLSDAYAADEEERELVREVSGDIAFALYDLELEEDRVRAEVALHDSERFLRSTLNGLTAHIAVVDGQGQIIQVNRAWRDFAAENGIPAELVSEGINYLRVCSRAGGDFSEGARAFAQGIREVIHGERELLTLEYPCPSPDRERWFVGRVTSFPDRPPRRVVVSHEEITELKQAERALKQSEKSYRELFNNSPVGIHLTDSDGRPYYVNPEMARMLGASSPNELLGRIRDFSTELYVRPERRSELVRILREHGEAEGFEFEARRLDGERIWMSLHARVREWITEDAFLIDGFAVDVTERRRAEEALRRKTEEQALLLESVPTQIWYLTDVDRYGAVNQAHADFNGLPREFMEYRRLWDFLPEEEARVCREGNLEVFRGGRQIRTEEWLRDASGEQRLVEIVKTPKLDAEGRVEYVVCAGADITERKQMEDRLREMSLYDGLTGLYNRSFFEEEMQRLADERYLPMGIMVCDVNGLKLINDTMGHALGDELLRDFAGILKCCFRHSDIVARIGGDEFAVLLPQTGREIVRDCSNRVRREMERYNLGEGTFRLSVSIGSSVQESVPLDMKQLFKRADDVMYKEKLQESYSPRSATVQALVKTLEARDYITDGHASRMHKYAQELGRALHLAEDRLHDLQILARFHDLGKVGIPDHILFKPGRLTEQEFEEMKRHCEIGHRIALATSDLAPVADYILKHHEWWDGRGYPLGIRGEEIPLECRILAIVDAYDAMTSERPYKGPMPREEAVKELRRCAGTQFDPRLVEEFVQILEGLDT